MVGLRWCAGDVAGLDLGRAASTRPRASARLVPTHLPEAGGLADRLSTSCQAAERRHFEPFPKRRSCRLRLSRWSPSTCCCLIRPSAGRWRKPSIGRSPIRRARHSQWSSARVRNPGFARATNRAGTGGGADDEHRGALCEWQHTPDGIFSRRPSRIHESGRVHGRRVWRGMGHAGSGKIFSRESPVQRRVVRSARRHVYAARLRMSLPTGRYWIAQTTGVNYEIPRHLRRDLASDDECAQHAWRQLLVVVNPESGAPRDRSRRLGVRLSPAAA